MSDEPVRHEMSMKWPSLSEPKHKINLAKHRSKKAKQHNGTANWCTDIQFDRCNPSDRSLRFAHRDCDLTVDSLLFERVRIHYQIELADSSVGQFQLSCPETKHLKSKVCADTRRSPINVRGVDELGISLSVPQLNTGSLSTQGIIRMQNQC